MTIAEAENHYFYEIEATKSYTLAKVKKALIKRLVVCNLIGVIFVLVGTILIISSHNTQSETLVDNADTSLKELFGFISLAIGSPLIIVFDIWALCIRIRGFERSVKINYLPCVKNLYLNYLKCEDMKPENKEFYKQKLEDIRNSALVNAIYGGSASVSSAVLFSALYK